MQVHNQSINVLELRNYLLKPGMTKTFIQYFNRHFVQPMTALGGHTLGQFIIKDVNDRFVWMRGFTDMDTRLQFLTDFYINSPAWKQSGPDANAMMINSDNVYLLRPLDGAHDTGKKSNDNSELKTGTEVVTLDFYTCNGTLEKVTALFKTSCLPFFRNLDVHDITLWVSEMSENKFPRLPAFQEQHLMLSITTYKDMIEYQEKRDMINLLPQALKLSILESVTTRHQLTLFPLQAL
jgi:hypothetical protein